MMSGDDRYAIAVRRPDGDIEVLTAGLPTFGRRWQKVPLVRGILALAEALPLGMRSLKWSAVHGLGEPERKATPIERVVQVVTILVVLAAIVTIPAYGAAIGRLSAVQRLFENHGAEHKVVAAYEAGVELTPENASVYSTRHVRCGTSLLLVIGAVSGVFYVLLGHQALPGLLASRIA